MQTVWLESLQDKEREEFKEYLLGSKKLLDILVKILYNRVREVESVNKKDYTSPGWSHEQAHRNGQAEELKSLIRLCTI